MRHTTFSNRATTNTDRASFRHVVPNLDGGTTDDDAIGCSGGRISPAWLVRLLYSIYHIDSSVLLLSACALNGVCETAFRRDLCGVHTV